MSAVQNLESDRTAVPLRDPDEVMRLERLGCFFQTRLSFMRSLIRRMSTEAWQIRAAKFDLDDQGYGTAIYEANTGQRVYSLVCFSHYLDPDRRTDRVIAEEWDSTFALFDGRPSADDIQRLSQSVPKQEAGRCSASELVLSRANKSLRLFNHIAERLANGEQPDLDKLCNVGYLMRTTAVYGNGKFGLADRDKIKERPELAGPFAAEMLAVYLIRCFTLDLVEHVAKRRNPERAVSLDDSLKRFLGIGNATGLGMAPFLASHPILINNWITAREQALSRVRSLPQAEAEAVENFTELLERARRHVDEWCVADERQMARILQLREEIAELSNAVCSARRFLWGPYPWDALYRWASQTFSPEGQELVVSLLLEPYPDLIDQLTEDMAAPDTMPIEAQMTVGELREIVAGRYAWALAIDFSDPCRQQRFWYASEEKQEPRLGERYEEPGAEKEMPLAIARDIQALDRELLERPTDQNVAGLLLSQPQLRHVVRRVQTAGHYPYAELRSNLVDAEMLPIDMLRCKLSFFGAVKFDPKSDRWTRITMYQGAPLAGELNTPDADDWAFPVKPEQPS